MSINQIIEKQSGRAFTLKKGEVLHVIDPLGEQVSDLVLFNAQDTREKISAGKTFDFEETILISEGNTLWSNKGNKMAAITEDTNGRNDFLLAPCSPETFKIMYGMKDYHPSCAENLAKSLKAFDIEPEDIPTAFNIFMNVQFQSSGKISVEPPTSQPGDYVCFEALMDLVVGLTACSAENSNNGKFKPIHYSIEDA